MTAPTFAPSRLQTVPRIEGDFIPGDYTQLFEHYYSYISKIIRKHGIVEESVEDVTMSILAKFVERDALATYDPNATFSHGGEAKKAQFITFLSGFVLVYLRHYQKRQSVEQGRVQVSLDATAPGTGDGDHRTYAEFLIEPHVDRHEALEEADLVRQIRARLVLTTPRNSNDHCDLDKLFAAVQRQVFESGRLNNAALAREFKVSAGTIQNWLDRLRTEVTSTLEVWA